MSTLQIICFIIVIAIIIFKLIISYLEQNKKVIPNTKITETIDRFIDENYKKIIMVLFILTFFSRIYKFGEVPTYISVDEAGAAYDAYSLSNYGVDRYLLSAPLYLINFGGGQSALYAYSTIPFIKLFGANIVSYRLPELLFYLMGMIVCYVLAKKFKNKKIAILYTLLIITCPWNIEVSRKGLDCNLLAPFFMLDLLILLTAKKDWHYLIAGILIGITLYTYCLSWILIPAFLIFYISYMLYLKKINFKQIVLLGIPIFILALPLMYLILLNNGIVSKTNFGIFTIPKLPLFRADELNIMNIFEYGLFSLNIIFFENYGRYVIYLMQVPLFIVGFIAGINKSIKSLKNREFDFDAFITMTFIVLTITNLCKVICTINNANILYFLVLYITSMGIVKLSKKSYIIPATILVTLIIVFIEFEANYFSYEYEHNLDNLSVYEDNQIMALVEEIENSETDREADKCIRISSKVQSYIYVILQIQASPYEINITDNGITSVGKYKFLKQKEIVKNTGNNKTIFIIDNDNFNCKQFLEENGYKEEKSTSLFTVLKNY